MLHAAGTCWAAEKPVARAEYAPLRAFRSFDRRNSAELPQSTIVALLQDERGLLWIGTLDGLATFDGSELAPVPKDPDSPSSGPVYGLARRIGGGIWAAGMRGLYELDGTRWRLRKTNRTLIRVREGPDGWLLTLAQDGSAYRIRRERGSGVVVPVPLPPAERGVDIGSLPDGRLVLATTAGVYELKGSRLERLGDRVPQEISSSLVARSGTLWAGTTGGELYRLDPRGEVWRLVESFGPTFGRVQDIVEDLRGRIWASGNDGQVAFGVPGGPFTRWGPENGLKKTAVMAMLADREGTMWFGLNGAGLQQWVGEEWSHRVRWQTDDRSEDSAQVFGLSATPDGFLAAVFHRGVFRWDGRHMWGFGREEGLTEDVRQAVEPTPGTLWVAARGGIFESKGGGRFRQTLKLDGGFINELFRSADGTWLAATSTEGLYRLSKEGWTKDRVRSAALPDPNVSVLASVGDTLWAGTLHGLAVFESDGTPRPSSALPVLGIEAINTILVRRSGEVWVGGFGGVAVVRGGGVRRLTEADGLPGDTVYSLAEAPDGSVWAGGSAGVSRFAGDRVDHYDSHSGLVGDECNRLGLLPLADGTVLVGTMASLARFDPAWVPLEKPPLRVFLDGPNPEGPVLLPAARRQLSLRWRAPWLDPTPVQYRTRIRRLGPEWSEASARNELRIENTPPGTWTVEIEARLTGLPPGAWCPTLEVTVEAQRRIWETGWADLVGLLLVGVVVFGLVRLRTRRLAQRAGELDAEVTRRTAELLESNQRLQDAQQALHELARRDALTGLYNRRAAEERLEEAFATARRQPAPLSVFLFDLDEFKALNDREGHAAGDAVLKHVADAIRRVVRESDVAVRYGGDEFLILLPGVDELGAYRSAERLRVELAETIPLSGGVATVTTFQDSGPESLVLAADRTLYAAKRAGRNRIERASRMERETAALG